MKILLLEPFFTGSHQRWAEELQQVSIHEIKILSLPGRHWKWRMHGGAVSLARQFLAEGWSPDLILATDMLDLSSFLALTRQRLAQVPCILYFHENQLTYPWSASDQDVDLKRDRHYGFINLNSAFVADAVWFNSGYHQEVFLSAASEYLRALPDFRELELVDQIRAKSRVVPLGINLKRFDPWQVKPDGPATLLWNHRWEYDKNPDDFFHLLFSLQAEKIDFRLIVLGESFRKSPSIFAQAREQLAEQILHFGFTARFEDYAQYLWRSDIIPVTSKQDFFGISAAEAIYCNCFPLLPNRLAFPAHIPSEKHPVHLYLGKDDLQQKLRHTIRNIKTIRTETYQYFVSRYDWCNLSTAYDEAFEQLIAETGRL